MSAAVAENDYESRLFLSLFKETSCRCLEVGAHDSPLATILCEAGHVVTSVDLRDYDGPKHHNHDHHRGDFVKLFPNRSWSGAFDVVYSVSALEHFGMDTYGDGRKPYYDVIAARYMYDALKPGGRCYVTVPYGGSYCEVKPHWRVYCHESFHERIQQDFKVAESGVMLCQAIMTADGKTMAPCTPITNEIMQSNWNGFPGISLIAKMIKDN